MAIKVREAQLEDVEKLISFQMSMADETEDIVLDKSILTRGIHALFSDPAKGKYLVAVNQNQVVGCLMLTYEWSDWRNGTVLWIQSVYVEKSNRGKGVYKCLYDFVKEEVKQSLRFRGIRLYVDKGNAAAQQVYEKLGMNGDHYMLYEWMKEY